MNDAWSSDTWVAPTLTTEDDLYRLYLEAIRFPRKKYGGTLVVDFSRSELMRALTVADAFILLLLTFIVGNTWATLACLSALTLCIFNIPVGFSSLPTLLAKAYLDRIPMPLPNPSSLRIGSPESISIIADYLAAGPVHECEAFIGRCQSERTKVERLLERALEVATRLTPYVSEDDILHEIYGTELTRTREQISILNSELERILRRETTAQAKLQQTQDALKTLRAVAEAAFQVRHLHAETTATRRASNDDQARKRLTRVCEDLDSTYNVVQDLQAHALARARATSEVQQLSHAS